MKTIKILILSLLVLSCSKQEKNSYNIVFLHHSTGKCIWNGSYKPSLLDRVFKPTDKASVPSKIAKHNKAQNTNYSIVEMDFPKNEPYGWKNYPFDYYNIWVKNAGEKPFTEEPTLEMLTKTYKVIIFKHCFPVSDLIDGSDSANIDSEDKTIANYKAQYIALRNKMNKFKETKFIVWTPAALVKKHTSEEQALLTKNFYEWVLNEWDVNDDNIYLWDFRQLETDGGLYLKDEYARNMDDSHPNADFSEKVSQLFVNRIIDVIENNGSKTTLTGESK